MSATLNDVTKKKAAEESAEQRAATDLVRLAKEQGLSLTGPDGAAQGADRVGARDRFERGDDRAPGL